MPRPAKEGLDFWCLDVDAFDDEKLVRLTMKAGHEAVAVWCYLQSTIYRVGMCYRWGTEEKEAFAYRRNLKIDFLDKCIEAMFDVKLYDREVFEETGYLTSKGTQKRFRAACVRRVPKQLPDGVDLADSYLSNIKKENKKENKNKRVNNNSQKPDNNSTYSTVSATETHINSAETTNKKPHGWRENTITHGEHKRVWLTEEEYQKLLETHGKRKIDAKIIALDAQIENGLRRYTRYTNHYAVIRNWCTQDKENGKTSNFEKNMEALEELEEHERAMRG